MDARFSDYQTRMLRIARHMDQLNQAIQLRARQPASDGEIAPLAHNLTQVRSTLLVCLVPYVFFLGAYISGMFVNDDSFQNPYSCNKLIIKNHIYLVCT